jgi:hypothetical protein
MNENPQDFWRRKTTEQRGGLDDPDGPARAWLAGELRRLADHIESGDYPWVFGCIVPDEGPRFRSELMAEWRVILSHPWGG